MLPRMPRRISVAVAVATLAAGCQAPPDRTYDAQWLFVRASPTSSTIEVVAFLNSCDRIASVHTIFSAKSVTFQVVGVDSGESCLGGDPERYLRVDLGAPLGDRRITGSCAPAPCSLKRGVPAESHWNNAPTYGS